MEKRLEIFFNDSLTALEYQINYFFKETAGKLHGIQYLIDGDEYIAFLTYTPEGEDEEEIESPKKGGASN